MIGDFQLSTEPVGVFVACPPPPTPDPFCGDNLTNGNEDCDWSDPSFGGNCRADCTLADCGDGIFDPNFGEQCDGGSSCTEQCLTIGEQDDECTSSDLCSGALVCGKGCYGSDISFGIDVNGFCWGIVVQDEELLCDVDFRCMPASQASRTIEDVSP